MRNIVFILGFITFWGCSSTPEKKVATENSSGNEAKNVICEQNYDSLLLRYANEFTATTVDLNSSMSSDLKSFLTSADTSCLKKQTEYKYFIALILGKLALHHLKCCNQHYDLYQMREGAASVIINGFNNLAGYETSNLEMLNSGLIIDYMRSDPLLSVNPSILNVLNTYEIESKRIEKMGN